MDEQQLTKKQRREFKRQQKLADREREAKKSRLSKVIVTVVIVLTVGGVGWLLVQAGKNTDTTPAGTLPDPTRGPAEAKVVIEEFSDFQCPACASAEPVVKQVLEQYGDQVQFVYNDFPLTSIHPNAGNAALAGQCAWKQGDDAFWKLHDLLFERQTSWVSKSRTAAVDDFKAFAGELTLDTTAFNQCLDNQETEEAVKDDEREARQRNVNSTPTFFVNGERVVGGSELAAAVERALGQEPLPPSP